MTEPRKPKIEKLEKSPPPRSEPEELELVEETLADLVEDQADGARGGWIPKSLDRTGCKYV